MKKYKIKPREDINGPLKIWDFPRKGWGYCVGLDSSTGYGDDYSSGVVLTRHKPFEQVAHFRVKWPISKVAHFANMLGLFYNTALMVVETNHVGIAAQDALVDEYKYPFCYMREERNKEDQSIMKVFGFKTDESSKWMLIREMMVALEQGYININDSVVLEEFLNFVYIEDKMKTGGSPGENDDTVISTMLSLHGCLLYQTEKPRDSKYNDSVPMTQHQKLLSDFIKKMENRQSGTIITRV